MKKNIVFLILISLLLVGNAWGITIYVDASNDTGVEDGTPISPYNTIQEAINAAVAGDIVSVAPGGYHGAITLKDQVKVISQQGPSYTLIDGMGARYAVNMPYTLQANTHLEGFSLRGSSILVRASNRVDFWAPVNVTIDNCKMVDAGLGVLMDPYATVTVSRTLMYFMNKAVDSWYYSRAYLKNVTMDMVLYPATMYRSYTYAYNTAIHHANSIYNTWGWYGTAYVYGSNNNYSAYGRMSSPNRSGWYPYINQSNTTYHGPMFVAELPHGADYNLAEGSPLIDIGMDIGFPYNGAAPDIGAFESDYYVSIPDQFDNLAQSYQEIPEEAFKNAGEQRRNAMNNKFKAVLEKLDAITDEMTNDEKITIYTECLNKLTNDILAKADGFYGGNPNNDWIVTQEEQDRLVPEINELIASLETEITNLSAQ